MREAGLPEPGLLGAGEKYRFGYQGEFAEQDDETGWNAFETRQYNPVTARWFSSDPYFQFPSPYMAMGNNPILYQDDDGRWVHIAAGAIIGGGAAIIKLALEPGDIDWTSGRTWGKIGTGAATGALIAAMPISALGVAGAGTVAASGDIVDQVIDVHYGHRKVIDLKRAAVNGLVTSATAGLGGVISQKLVKSGRDVFHATGKVPWYRHFPNLNTAAVNSMFDVSRFIYDNKNDLYNGYSLLNFHETQNFIHLPKGSIEVGPVEFLYDTRPHNSDFDLDVNDGN